VCLSLLLVSGLCANNNDCNGRRLANVGQYRTQAFVGNSVRSHIGVDNNLVVTRQGKDWKVYNPNTQQVAKVPNQEVNTFLKQMPSDAELPQNMYIAVGQYEDGDYKLHPHVRLNGGAEKLEAIFWGGAFAGCYGVLLGCAGYTCYLAGRGGFDRMCNGGEQSQTFQNLSSKGEEALRETAGKMTQQATSGGDTARHIGEYAYDAARNSQAVQNTSEAAAGAAAASPETVTSFASHFHQWSLYCHETIKSIADAAGRVGRALPDPF